MEHIPVVSTNLASVGYDPDAMLLEISFKNGSVYSYANVEPETYQAMLDSGDAGRYFAEVIKPQRMRYVFTRVT